MASAVDLAKYDGLGLADLVRRKEVTPTELLDTVIAAFNGHPVDAECADAARKGRPHGPSGSLASMPRLRRRPECIEGYGVSTCLQATSTTLFANA